MAIDLLNSAFIRHELLNRGLMYEWPNDHYPVKPGYPPQDVQRYCVQDKAWQVVRLSMKGVPTHKKLAILKHWWDAGIEDAIDNGGEMSAVAFYETEVQVGNYLGALRRGGQLNDSNQVRKYI